MSTFVAPSYTPDQFSTLFDLPLGQLANAQRYQELRLRRNTLTSAEVTEFNTLTDVLKDYLITPERWNHFQTALMNMQWFIKDNVEGFVLSKQQEFQALVDAFNYRGVYSSATRYFRNNTVLHNGESFLCITTIVSGIVNTPPPVGSANSHWVKIAQKGDTGATGPQGAPGLGLVYRGTYNTDLAYLVGDLVSFQGNAYACILNAPPGVNPAVSGVHWNILVREGTNTELQSFTNTAVLGAASAIVEIGLSVQPNDLLLVYVNSTFAQFGVDYNFTGDRTGITKLGTPATWNINTIINFIVIKTAKLNIFTELRGGSTFTGVTPRTITHNLNTSDYTAIIVPTADTGAVRWWVANKTNTTFQVVCSAACVTSFDWLVRRGF